MLVEVTQNETKISPDGVSVVTLSKGDKIDLDDDVARALISAKVAARPSKLRTTKMDKLEA